jgi:hypothetical protein
MIIRLPLKNETKQNKIIGLFCRFFFTFRNTTYDCLCDPDLPGEAIHSETPKDE